MLDVGLTHPREPRSFGERAALALARLFQCPTRWDGGVLPYAVRLPDADLIIGVGDAERAMDPHKVRPLAEKESCDVLATYVDQMRGGHVMHFDIALTRNGTTTLYPACRLCASRDDRLYFVPEANAPGRGPAVALMPGRLEAVKKLPFRTAFDRTTALHRGQGLLYEMIWGRTQYAVAPEVWDAAPSPALTYPDKLVVLFPMYQAREYRRVLSAVDDALVVHRRPNGEWLLELRPMARLGPRRYAAYLRQVAADLEAGYTLVIVDRDAFLEELAGLALRHASAKERDATERAAQIVAERQRYQTRDHGEALSTQHAFYRALIVARPRLTRSDPEDRNRNTMLCRHGVPTPRSEQLWHSIRADLRDVRSCQRGMVAWEKWTRHNRPDLPRQKQ